MTDRCFTLTSGLKEFIFLRKCKKKKIINIYDNYEEEQSHLTTYHPLKSEHFICVVFH